MTIYNFFLEKVVLPIGDFFAGSSYMKSLKNWRKIDLYSAKELEEIQKKRLLETLTFAKNFVPFYKDIELSKSKNAIDSLCQFPVLSKNELIKYTEQLLTENKDKLIKTSSSGSSGVRTEVFMNPKDLSSLRAGNTHWWEWGGYRIGSPLLQTGMTTKRGAFKKIKDILFRTKYINAFALTNEQLEEVCNDLANGNHQFILGYASSIYVIAEYALDKKFEINIKSAISLGDKLFPHYRRKIEKAFNCKVYETYGSAEGFLIASQYDLEYLYINSPQVYLEVLDDNDNPVKDGEIGHVVVTRLDSRAMPLIRYRLGDLCIKLPKDKYPKKRAFNYPLLEKVIGRDTDIVILPDGKKLIVHSFTGVFEHIKEIKQFKVIQKNRNGIEIQYIPNDQFQTKVLDKITLKLQEFILNDEFDIKYFETDIIEPTDSGKPQIIQSFLNQ